MRGALLIDKIIVDEVGSGLREACDGAITTGFGRSGNFGEFREIGNVSAGSDPIEMLFEKFVAHEIEIAERHAASLGSRGFMDEDDGFGLESEAAMVRKNAGDVNPIAVAIFVGRTAGRRERGEAKRKATLAIVVNGAEADFVVAFVDGSVVDEFGGVKEMEAVHATAA